LFHLKCWVLLKLKLIYDRQSVCQSVLVPGTQLGPVTNFFSLLEIFFRQLRVCYFVAPSLTRGWVCNLLYNCFWPLPEQSLLGRSPAELTAIFYCLISDCVPPSTPLTTHRDYGGGIQTRLHTGLVGITVSRTSCAHLSTTLWKHTNAEVNSKGILPL
jgi:hypothetical protein